MSIVPVILAVVLLGVVCVASVWVTRLIVRIFCSVTGNDIYTYDFGDSEYGVSLFVAWLLQYLWDKPAMLATPFVSALILILLGTIAKHH